MFDDALAHAADDSWQFVTTDMGMSLIEQAVVATEVVEEFHNALHIAAFLAAREEFAIGESTRTAFAKTVVGLGVESEIAVERSDVFLTLSDILASFVDDWFDTVLNQGECGEQARRSCTDDDDIV